MMPSITFLKGTIERPIVLFYFSVGNKIIADQLMRLQGRSVTVHYKQKNGTLPWRGESEYIVDSVRVEQ